MCLRVDAFKKSKKTCEHHTLSLKPLINMLRNQPIRIFRILLHGLLSACIGFVIAYSCLALFALFFSDKLIFPRFDSSYVPQPSVQYVSTRDGERIAFIHRANPRSEYTILYSHGNGEDLGRIQGRLELLYKMGFSILAYDYPGYGLSSGKPTEKGTYAAIDALYAHATQALKLDPKTLVLYGRSLGGGPSIDLAVREPVGGLVLEATFVSTFRVMTRYPLLPWDKYENLKKITSVNVPILFLHGTADKTVPFWHSQVLWANAGDPRYFLWVQDAGHNDLLDSSPELYQKSLSRLMRSIADFKTR
jgi:pimeloyl-ACP methyl ester carboxylesterase